MLHKRRLRLFGAVALLLLLDPTSVGAQAFADRTARIRQMLQEARAVEQSDPASAQQLRARAQSEFGEVRRIADNLQEDVRGYDDDIAAYRSDQAWAAFWTALQAPAHMAIAADKTLDVALLLTRADSDPRVERYMKVKGWLYTGVQAGHDIADGKEAKAVLDTVHKAADPELSAVIGTGKAFDKAAGGDLAGAIDESLGVGADLGEVFQETEAERAFKIADKTYDAVEHAQKAGEAVEDTFEILEMRDRMTSSMRDFQDSLETRADRFSDEATDIGMDHPELFDDHAPRSGAADEETLNLLRFLQEIEPGEATDLSPDHLDPNEPLLRERDNERALDRVADDVRGQNDEARLRLVDGQFIDERIADDLDAAVDRERADRDARDGDADPAGGSDADDDHDHDDDGHDDDGHDHCSSGAFQCPNGFPWPECTHPEKHDCPPAEFAEQSRQEQKKKADDANPENQKKDPP